MTKQNKTQDLLRMLGKRAPAVLQSVPKVDAAISRSPAMSEVSSPAVKTARQNQEARPPIRGRAIQFYLHETDEKLIREFAVWLAPHRKRINDSLVIKSVLRCAKTGSSLLAAYDEARALDGRVPRGQKSVDAT